jgi:hypothetical protein
MGSNPILAASDQGNQKPTMTTRESRRAGFYHFSTPAM